MNSKSQTNLTIGIAVATTVAAAGTFFAFSFLTGSKTPPPAATTEAAANPGMEPAPRPEGATESDPYGAVAADSSRESAEQQAAAGDGSSPSADDAQGLGESVGQQLSSSLAQTLADPNGLALSEDQARTISEEQGRLVAQEIADAIHANTQPRSGSDDSGLTAAQAEQIGLEAGRRAAAQIVAEAGAAPEPAPAPEPVETARVSEPESAPAPAPAETVSKPKPAKKSRAVSDGPARIKRNLPGADAVESWWKSSGGSFSLAYAGQTQGEKAIALLFSAVPDSAALAQSARVYDSQGRAVSGSWEPGTNPRLVVLRGLAPGRYTVVLSAGLSDAQGQRLGKELHGPVYVN